MATTQPSSTELTDEEKALVERFDSWHDYLDSEVEQLLITAGPKLVKAMLYSRAIEDPQFYGSSKFPEDYAKALKENFGITKTGYWERIALRALCIINLPEEEMKQMIAAARKRDEIARAAVRRRISKGPGGPYKEVDLSALEL